MGTTATFVIQKNVYDDDEGEGGVATFLHESCHAVVSRIRLSGSKILHLRNENGFITRQFPVYIFVIMSELQLQA